MEWMQRARSKFTMETSKEKPEHFNKTSDIHVEVAEDVSVAVVEYLQEIYCKNLLLFVWAQKFVCSSC